MKFNLLALIFSMLLFQFKIVEDDNNDPLNISGGSGSGEKDKQVSQEDLEKSLDLALEEMNKADDDDDGDDEEEEDENEEDEDEDEYEEMKKKKKKKKKKVQKSEDNDDLKVLSKSLPDMLEEDDDVSKVMDAVPFVKAMINSLDDQMTGFCKAIIQLNEKMNGIKEQLSKSTKLGVAQATLVKSVSEEVRKIGDSPLPRKANLGKNLQIMKKSVDGTGEEKVQMSKTEACDKLFELRKSGKIDSIQLSIAERRINKNIAIDPNIERMLVS